MRVALWPLYPEWGCSSRLRVWTLHRELLAMGIESAIAFDPTADVFVLQKHRDPEVIARAGKAKFLVYDFDDTEVAEALPMVERSARLLTTDTRGHAQWYLDGLNQRIFAAREALPCHVTVIPDPIDYAIPGPLPPTEGKGVCWFGHPSNFGSMVTWAKAITDAGLSLTTICTQNMNGYPNTMWAVDTFVATLRRFAVCVLSHDGADPGKSANKLVTAITAGVPCVVSDTPEYAAILQASSNGLGIAASPEQVVDMAAALMHPDVRKIYLGMAQPYVWDRYNPRRIAERWLEVVRERM